MGNASETDDLKDNNDEALEGENAPEDAEAAAQAAAEAESGGETAKDEFEIVKMGDQDGSQPSKINRQNGFQRRVNKLNARNEASVEEANSAQAALALAEDKNRVLALALEQAKAKNNEPLTPPDPNDFDDGSTDPKYVTALTGYIKEVAAGEVQNNLADQPSTTRPNEGLRQRQQSHYEAADKLGVSDYDATEDVSVNILGKEVTNQLINSSDASPIILYYLGKNPDKAKDVAELIKNDPIKGVLALGELGAELKVQKRSTKANPAPDPDDDLEGSIVARNLKRGPEGATYS